MLLRACHTILYAAYLKCRGIETRGHPIEKELVRSKATYSCHLYTLSLRAVYFVGGSYKIKTYCEIADHLQARVQQYMHKISRRLSGALLLQYIFRIRLVIEFFSVCKLVQFLLSR